MVLRRTDSFGYMVNHLARLFARALERRIQPHGLSPGQFPVLLALWEREGLTQAELCRIVQIEQPTMANTLNRMERDGLIRRAPDPHDGRRSLVLLTERARALEEPATAAATAVNSAAVAGLGEGDRAELRRLIAALTGNLERDSGV